MKGLSANLYSLILALALSLVSTVGFTAGDGPGTGYGGRSSYHDNADSYDNEHPPGDYGDYSTCEGQLSTLKNKAKTLECRLNCYEYGLLNNLNACLENCNPILGAIKVKKVPLP